MSDSRLQIGPGWQKLPHFYDALHEARCIVHVLWKHPKYGRSRETNSRGVRYQGAPRPMDAFVSYKHAVCAITKIILRDRYGEVPESADMREVSMIGRHGPKRSHGGGPGELHALKW